MEFRLTEKEFEWFGDRISERQSGKVYAPTHCYNKLRKLSDREDLSNQEALSWLIDNVYNIDAYYSHTGTIGSCLNYFKDKEKHD